jgi:uncharacterized protein (DUF849 family)
VLIQACLNGSREPGAHKALPLSPDELAQEARRALDAGAGAVHIHPRRSSGEQSLAAEDCGTAIAAVRAQCPNATIGVSTGIWITSDAQQRLALIEEWQGLPDFASVNFSEAGTEDLCSLLLAKGIGIEVGISTIEDARLLHELSIADRCLRLLIEPEEEEIANAQATVEAIERVLDGAGIKTPRLLHGSEATAWPLLEIALQRGYDMRIGFEDTLLLPDGTVARNNAELVAVAYRRVQGIGRFQASR